MAKKKIELFEIDIDFAKVTKDTAALVKQAAILKEEQKKLKKETNNLTTATEEQAQAYVNNDAALKAINGNIADNNKVLKASTVNIQKSNMSLREAQQALTATDALWRQTTKLEGKNSKSSKDLAAQKKKLSERINTLNKEQGDYKANVGNYTNSITEAAGASSAFGGSLGGVVQGAKAANTAMMSLAANPVGLVLVALATVLITLYKVFADTDDAGTALDAVFAKLSAGFDVLKQRATMLIDIFKDLSNGDFAKAFSRSKDMVSGLSDEIKRAGDEAYRLTYELDRLKDYATASALELAKLRSKFEELKAAEADQTKSTRERAKAAKDALKVLARMTKIEVGMARDMYTAKLQMAVKSGEVNEKEARAFMQLSADEQQRIREQGGKLAKWRSDLGDEEYQELEDLLVKEFEIKTKYTKKSVDLQRKSSGYAKAAAKLRATDAQQQAAEEARVAAEASNMVVQVVREQNTQVVQAHRDRLVTIAQMDEDASATRLEAQALNAANEAELLAESERGKLELKKRALEQEYMDAVMAADKVGADTTTIHEKYKQAQLELAVQTANSEAQLVSNLVGAVGAMFGENVEAQKATKAAQVGISSIQGAAEAFAQSMSLGPIAGPIVGGVLAAGQIASGVISIKKIYAVKNPLPKGGKSMPRVGAPTSGAPHLGARISDGGLLHRKSTDDANRAAADARTAEGLNTPVLVVDDVTAAQRGLHAVEVSTHI